MAHLTKTKKECESCGYVAKDAKDSKTFWHNELAGMDICNSCYQSGFEHLKDLLLTIEDRRRQGLNAVAILEQIEKKLQGIRDETEGWEELPE